MSMMPGIGGGLPQNIQTGAMLKAREAAERALQARRAASGSALQPGRLPKTAPSFELPPPSASTARTLPLSGRIPPDAGVAPTSRASVAMPDGNPAPRPKRAEASAETAPTVQHDAGSVNVSPPWERTVREVQDIASRSGFIGVTERDIRQAYLRGESLLADYRV